VSPITSTLAIVVVLLAGAFFAGRVAAVARLVRAVITDLLATFTRKIKSEEVVVIEVGQLNLSHGSISKERIIQEGIL